MRNIGIFWGIMGVILAIGSIMRFMVIKFYNIFISGLSKKYHKRLVDETISLIKILEEDHGIFAFGSSVSILFHFIIMIGCGRASFWGILVGVAFVIVIFMGLIYKYIYIDRGGKIKRYHMLSAGMFIILLIFHLGVFKY